MDKLSTTDPGAAAKSGLYPGCRGIFYPYRDCPWGHRMAGKGEMHMLSAALFLLANSLFLTLRLTGDTGSFPKPLSAGEERMYLERSLAGDLEARNILVEHNLRLVAHIIKKM